MSIPAAILTVGTSLVCVIALMVLIIYWRIRKNIKDIISINEAYTTMLATKIACMRERQEMMKRRSGPK